MSALKRSNPVLSGHLILKVPADQTAIGLPSRACAREASRQLQKFGFLIEDDTSLSLAATAPRANWEKVFRAELEEVLQHPQSIVRHQYGRSLSAPSYWRWRGEPRIPPELTNTITGVVMPEPVEFF